MTGFDLPSRKRKIGFIPTPFCFIDTSGTKQNGHFLKKTRESGAGFEPGMESIASAGGNRRRLADPCGAG